jgi:hypothetical protein
METQLAFVAYIIAVISLAVSLYVVYLLSELKDRLNLPKNKKPPQQQRRPSTQINRAKGHWD